MKSIEQRIAEELGVARSRSRRRSSFSTAARPCRSSRATARKSPACSTTRNCARWRSGCGYLRELEERRTAILDTSASRASSTPRSKRRSWRPIPRRGSKTSICRIKPKRRTKAQIAREAGLEPLAPSLLTDPSGCPKRRRRTFIDAREGRGGRRGGARRRARDPGRAFRRGRRADRQAARGIWGRGRSRRRCARQEKRPRARNSPTISTWPSRLRNCPSHRILALFRGEKEACSTSPSSRRTRRRRRQRAALYEQRIARTLRHRRPRPAGRQLADRYGALGVADARLSGISASICACGSGKRRRTRRCASSPAICATCCSPRRPARARRWASIRASAPASRSPSSTRPARSSATTAIYPHEPQQHWDGSLATSGRLAREHSVELIAIGNGTASRETDKLAADLIARIRN